MWKFLNIFSKKQKPEGEIGGIVAIYPSTSIFSWEKPVDLTREGFERTVWVYSAVMKIAKAIAGVRWGIFNEKDEEVDHKLLTLLTKKANPYMLGTEFIEALVAFLLLQGNTYLYAYPDRNNPVELWVLRPDRVGILTDRAGDVVGYEYRTKKSRVRYTTEQVLHIKFFNPSDDYYGLSPLTVARTIIGIERSSEIWNASLLENGASPSGALMTKERLTESQRKEIETKLKTLV